MNINILKFGFTILAVLILEGCVGSDYMSRDTIIETTSSSLYQLELGTNRSEALPIINNAVSMFRNKGIEYIKPPQKFIKGDKKYEIFYVMSSRIPDGLITIEEFTPYIFENDILIGVGWTSVGGLPADFRADIKIENR